MTLSGIIQKFISFHPKRLIRQRLLLLFVSLFILIALVAGCTLGLGNKPAATPTPTATILYLVPVPLDATATLTPFQPGFAIETPISAVSDPLAATVTNPPVDPNIILPVEPTQVSFYIPPYAPAPVPVLTDTEINTFVLLGSDKRPGETYFRTDTIIIAGVRPSSGQVTLISVPRDLYVYIPTVGMDRINAAYEYGVMFHYPGGGEALLKDTILYNLGIRIDHLAIVDFDGFSRIVDTLGGLDVPVYCPYTDWHLMDPSYDPTNENNWSLFTVGPGVVHMNGDLALWYARSRKKSSDFDRGRRSQEVLRALYARGLQTDAISKIPQLYSDFSSAVITDMNLEGILKLAPLTLHLNNADIRSFYIGREDVTGWVTAGGASVLLPNGPAVQSKIQQALAQSARRVEQEALTIEIRNGTGNAGWAELAAQRLNYAGYDTRITSADRLDYTSSFLYDLQSTPDPSRGASLLAVLGLPPSAYLSAITETDVDFVLILGQDYQPCFNPANLAP